MFYLYSRASLKTPFDLLLLERIEDEVVKGKVFRDALKVISL